MSAATQLTAEILDDEAAYLARAGTWRAGDAFPLLRDPTADRALELDGLRDREVPVPLAWPGVVVSATVDEVVGAAARIYARCTGRPLVEMPVADVPARLGAMGDEHVALVSTPAELATLPYWPTAYAPRTGVLVARSTRSLLSLLFRSLSRPFFPPAPVTSMVYGTFPGARSADISSFGEIGLAVGRRSSVFTVRGHGRECCAHMVDAVICGRSSLTLTPATVAGPERAACEVDGMCIRRDIDDSRRVLASSVRADVVLAETCRAIAIGDDWLSTELALSLGFLEGDAVALIGAMGSYTDRGVTAYVVSALARGDSLGEVVERLNSEYGSPISAQPTFGLLGDPGLRLDGQVEQPQVEQPHAEDQVEEAGLPARPEVRTARPPAASPAPGSRPLAAAFLGRMSMRPRGGAVPADDELLPGVLRRIRESSWDFWGALQGFALFGAAPVTCPSCASPRASQIRFGSASLDAVCDGVVCSRCSDVLWHVYPRGSARAVEIVSATISAGVRRGGTAELSIALRNGERDDLDVTVGSAVRHGYGAKIPQTHVVTMAIPPGETLSRTMEFGIPDESRVDQLKVVWLAEASDQILVRIHSLWIR